MAEVLGTGIQRSGKNSRVSVNGTVLAMAKWDVDYKGQDLDTVNFESNGVEEGILGIQGGDWNFSGNWDAGQNPIDDPPGLYPRDDLQNLTFYENVSDNVYFNFTYARVRSAKNGAGVRELVTFASTGMSQGDFDIPTGSV